MYMFLAGVADADLLIGSQLIGSAKTLTDSSIGISVSAEDIRAGKAAKLWGRYFHTSGMTATLMDAMFKLDYIALNVGKDIEIGGEAIAHEDVACTTNGQITVVGVPQDFGGLGTIGWVRKMSDTEYTTVTFVGNTANVQGALVGENYCVKYNKTNDAQKQLTVSAGIIPSEIHVIMYADLFLGESSNVSSASKVGQVQIDIPRLQMDGNVDLSMTMTGASTTSLSGSALATSGGGTSCDDDGTYAYIKQIVFNSNWYDGLVAIGIEDAEIELNATTTTENIVAWAVYGGMTASKQIAPSKLTYTLKSGSKFAVDAETGVISTTAIATTTENIIVTVKGAGLPASITSISAPVQVTYTA